jgi:hypothetical protein
MLVKRLAAVYLILLAVVVAGHFLATQLYDPMLEGAALDVWRVLDPLMVSGAIIALVVALDRKLNGGDSQGITREYLEANFTFYFSAALLLAITWNWFGVEWVEPRNDQGLLWIFIDSTLPLLLASTGIRLLRESSSR